MSTTIGFYLINDVSLLDETSYNICIFKQGDISDNLKKMRLISMRTTPVLKLKRGTRIPEYYISSWSSLFAKVPVCRYPE